MPRSKWSFAHFIFKSFFTLEACWSKDPKPKTLKHAKPKLNRKGFEFGDAARYLYAQITPLEHLIVRADVLHSSIILESTWRVRGA